MVATAAAIATILGTAVQAGSTIAGTMANKNNPTAQRQNEIALASLQDSRNNDQYQRALSTLINQRSIAGSQDDYGSSVQYDPATNQWVTKLGAQPKMVQDASDLASIARNTTDMRQAQIANAAAAERATAAGPLADRSRRDLETYRDMPSSALSGLLMQRATDAARASYDPLNQEMFRTSQRTGTAAGPVAAALGKQEYDSLRDSLSDAQIKGLSGVDQLNAGRRTSLEQAAATGSSLATPQFQYPGIQTSSNRDTLANLMAARAQQGGVGPAYGAGGVNTGAGQVQAAYKNLQGSVPSPSNAATEGGKQIGSLLSNKEFTSSAGTIYNKLFGKDDNSNPNWLGTSGGTYDADNANAMLAKLRPYMNDTQGNADFAASYRPSSTEWG
jgi:hypothetical protein